ncbi:MAG: phospholipid-binding protein [Hyphomicrobiales bacterium]
MTRLQIVVGVIGISSIAEASSAAAFSVSFDWANVPKCTSGYPNTIESPEFGLSDVPKGAVRLEFALHDLDVAYDHGGGAVEYSGGNTVPAGSFTYKSPCPPNGPHLYEWTIKAVDASGKTLATTTATKRYP